MHNFILTTACTLRMGKGARIEERHLPLLLETAEDHLHISLCHPVFQLQTGFARVLEHVRAVYTDLFGCLDGQSLDPRIQNSHTQRVGTTPACASHHALVCHQHLVVLDAIAARRRFKVVHHLLVAQLAKLGTNSAASSCCSSLLCRRGSHRG